MDVNLARTFLEVAATGNFVEAGRRLHVTQSTVSARVQNLEEQLGARLFVRSKSGATLTPAGRRFERYATALVRVWQQARHELSAPDAYRAVISIGGETSLWDTLLLDWLGWMHREAPDVAVRAERGTAPVLMRRLVDGSLDLGVLYTPQQRPDLRIEKLFDNELVLVATERIDDPGRIAEDRYVYVDWGPEFRAYHTQQHPGWSNPHLYVDSGAIGLRYILDNGGACYLPARAVTGHELRGKLFRVDEGTGFVLPVFTVYSDDGFSDAWRVGLEGLRLLASKP